MCIIASSEAGRGIPSRMLFERMWRENPDGGGIMYHHRGRVHIVKGFMDFESYYEHIEALNKAINLTECDVVFHMRIGTHGSIGPENTHPFPLTNKVKNLRALRFKADVGIAHNGIIPIKTEGNLSDTMQYIKDVAYPESRHNEAWYNDVGDINKSRLCILDNRGIHYVGNWYTADDGIKYSHYIDTYEDMLYEDITYKTLCELTEGYLITKESVEEIEAGEYFMDVYGHVYIYDYVYDVCYPIDGLAVTYEGSLIKYRYEDEYVMA